VQPRWKEVLKVLLVIAVIVVVALVVGPAAGTIGTIVGGAIVGAAAGATIQLGNNIIDGKDSEPRSNGIALRSSSNADHEPRQFAREDTVALPTQQSLPPSVRYLFASARRRILSKERVDGSTSIMHFTQWPARFATLAR
jgi:hypothetical protein